MNPYKNCPTYETEHLHLRLVAVRDAEDLLKCYSDRAAVARMNCDGCTNDFYYTSVTAMRSAIAFWLREYNQERYVRFAVVDKSINHAVGTVEIFGGTYGVLRIDLCSAYETEEYLCELFSCAVQNFYYDFAIENMCIKILPTAEVRNKIIKQYGFVPTENFRPGLSYYARKKIEPIAYCGLACCVCTHDATCVGCQAGGCEAHGWCKNYNCCKEKNLNGCWECPDFPCKGTMLDKMRIKAFAAFAKQYGADELAACVLRNKQHGIVYHYQGELIGDYDKCKTEEEIFKMLLEEQ